MLDLRVGVLVPQHSRTKVLSFTNAAKDNRGTSNIISMPVPLPPLEGPA